MALNTTIDPAVLAAAVAKSAVGAGHVAVVVPADASLGAIDVFHAMPAGDRALWWQPTRRLLVVGHGVAARLVSGTGDDTRRFSSLPLDELVHRVHVVDPYDTGIAPRLLGGFSFFADEVWEAFGPGDLTLPEVSYVKIDDAAAWIVVVEPSEVADAPRKIDRVLASVDAGRGHRSTVGPLVFDHSDRVATRKLIESTIRTIRDTELDKVVIARTAVATSAVDVMALLDVLAGSYADCATFAFERADEWFVGATPELLVRKQGSSVTSAALAATAPRHDDPVLDRIELDSLSSSKQLEEHRHVVDAVVDALENTGVATTIHPQQVMELRHVRHLFTAVEGVAPADVDVLDLVGALHPTPAVGGVPGSGALEWIRSKEGFVRGWYAAPVGVVDLAGNGEFRVALRSARITGPTVCLYAGAGIVGGSDPDAEMDEIDLKLGVMSGAIEAAR